MAFDITTARPVSGGFDISTARPAKRKTSPSLPREAEVERLISERADPVETLREEVETPFKFGTPAEIGKSLLKPAVTTAKLTAIPISRISSAVGGLGLGLQKGKGFKEAGRMAKEGLLGEKEFRSFDPLRAAGAPDIVASGLELFTEIAIPLKALNKVSKVFRGPIQKFSDKKLLKIGSDLAKSSDDSVTAVGKPLTKAYQPINQVPVNPEKVLNEVVDLEPALVKHLEKEVGQNIDSFIENFTIEKARKLKGAIAQLKPTAFGKAEKGAIELATDKQVNRVYGSIKKAMQETLETQGLKKEASKLLKADEAFEDTINASNFIKRTITDPVLRKPTRAGRVAGGLEREADVTARSALNKLRESSFFVRQSINKSVDGLKQFNQLQKRNRLIGQVGTSALRGLVVGGTVGRILKETE